MGKTYVTMKIYLRDPELRHRLKRIAVEFGTYEAMLRRFADVYEGNPEIFRTRFR